MRILVIEDSSEVRNVLAVILGVAIFAGNMARCGVCVGRDWTDGDRARRAS